MVAVVSGNTLGLVATSRNILGGDGAGNAATGRSGEQVYVNSATGNLVIQDRDEYLTSLGIRSPLVRTYNSQGLLDDDNGDNWRLGVHTRLQGMVGAVNTSGSRITRVFGDGAAITYFYDVQSSQYVSTDGDGAHDTLTYNAALTRWTWQDGTSRRTDTFDSGGRLLTSQDTDGNTTTYTYAGGLLRLIEDASGQETHLDYVGNNLAAIHVVSDGATQTLTHYEYDPQNRLHEVRVDLSPDDNSIADGDIYLTTYTYEGTSRRIASISQGDGVTVGSTVGFTYQLLDGQYRLRTFEDAEGRITTWTYTSPSGSSGAFNTTVTADSGVLSTTEQQTTTTLHDVGVGTLTFPTGGSWSGEFTLESTGQPHLSLIGPVTAFDPQGNGFAAWASQNESTIDVRRYDATTDTWTTSTVLTTTGVLRNATMATDAEGNALLAWREWDVVNAPPGDFVNIVRVVRYDAATGSWSAPTTFDPPGQSATSVSLSINGDHAALLIEQQVAGSELPPDVYVARLSAGTWSAPELIDDRSFEAVMGSVAIDAEGNILATWTQSDDTSNSAYSAYFDASAEAWSTPAVLESDAIEVFAGPIYSYGAGQAFTTWATAEGEVLLRRVDLATGVIGAPESLGTFDHAIMNLAVDANGNMLLAWIQQGESSTQLFVNGYHLSTNSWSGPQVIATLPDGSSQLAVSVRGGNVAVAWAEYPATGPELRLMRFNGVWSAPETIGSSSEGLSDIRLNVDSEGRVTAVWAEGNFNDTIVANQYTSAGAPYYTVQSGDTWASIAQTIYGTSAVADDLRLALGDPALTAGVQLSDLPPRLAVHTTTTVTVPAYYTVPTGATWASIAEAVYGTTDPAAALALQVAAGSPALVAGLHLTVPLTLSYTAAAANTGVLDTTEVVIEETPHVIDFDALTSPGGNTWSGAQLFATDTFPLDQPRVAFDADGNGFAAWVDRVGSGVRVRRYDNATGVWGPEQLFANPHADPFGFMEELNLSVDASGDAILGWMVDQGTTEFDFVIQAVRFDATSGTWGSVGTLSDPAASDMATALRIVMNGDQAMATWVELSMTNPVLPILNTAYLDGGAWSSPQPVAPGALVIAPPSITIDDDGSVTVAFAYVDSPEGEIACGAVTVFDPATGTWGTPQILFESEIDLEANFLAAPSAQYGADADGNGIAVWSDGAQILYRRFDAATGTWGSAATLRAGTANTLGDMALTVDDDGNVVLAWTQQQQSVLSLFVTRYDAATNAWGEVALLENSVGNVESFRVIGSGDNAAVVWVQEDGTGTNAYIARYTGIWREAELLENDAEEVSEDFDATIDSEGNIAALWSQGQSLYANRFTAPTGPLYYTVQPGDTWGSIAQTLYGSSAVASLLQSALGNPALSTGLQLSGFPPTLTLITSTTVTVPPYYTVPAGATWESVTQAVYGVSDPGAVAALQAMTGSPTLTEGLHLPVPLTLAYEAGGERVYLQTTVTDTRGDTTYENDANGRLVRMLSPTVGGGRLERRYVYDGEGNVSQLIEDPSGLNRITTYEYENGNLTYTRDAFGNTVTRTYSATNQLLTETRYTTPDPDGPGSGQASGVLTTRYVYDTDDHLRFVISADGRVTEKRYFGNGTVSATLRYADTTYDLSGLSPTQVPTQAALETWAAARNLLRVQREDYAYDFRGNLSTVTAYERTDSNGVGIAAGASVTRYVYDQRGQLLRSFDARGEATANADDYSTTYIYDGLGRLLSTVEWVSDTATPRATVTQYDDALNRTVTTYTNGLITTSTFNGAGQLISVANSAAFASLGTTTYEYDAAGRLRCVIDPLGHRQYTLYDAAGRRVGTVDADGTLTEHTYNGASQLIKTIQYADRLSDGTLAALASSPNMTVADLRDSLATVPERDPSRDRITRSVYDAAGQLVYAIDAEGNVAHSIYDGAGRITEIVQYATSVTIARSVDELTTLSIPLDPANDRHTRYFYDNSGNRIGVLDGEGFLTESIYDAAGQLVEEVRWWDDTNVSLRATGSLQNLHDSITPESARDIRARYFYDGQGRQIGELDGQGYLTETTYYPSGHVWQTIRYDRQLTYSATANPFQTLRDAALAPPAIDIHTTTNEYDGTGRLLRQTNYEGSLTGYEYDDERGVTSVTHAQDTPEARTKQTRYDALGRVVAELSAEGAALLTEGMSETQVNTIWNQYAVHYAYDLAGRRISATDQNGVRTLFFYDADGRQRYSVNAHGEVSESRYDALGQLVESISYHGRVIPANLAPGAALASVTAAVAAIRNDDRDHHTHYTYTLTGKVRTTTTAEGTSLTFDYNAFGEEESTLQVIDATRTLETRTTYDRRGLQDIMRWDPNGLNLQENRDYDAFGRLATTVDKNGNTRRLVYDRIGRVIESYYPSSPFTNPARTFYDAFGRVTFAHDRLDNVTSYLYDDEDRSVIVTTPEGISFTSIHNRHGQVTRVTDPSGNVTVTEYDENGNITQVSDSLTRANDGVIEVRDYDDAGRLTSVTDARGVITSIEYDAANRVFRRTVDSGPGGLARVTQYTYDGTGLTFEVTDENGIVTRTEYDRDGRVQQVTVDPGSTPRLNIVTRYQYDAVNNLVLVTEGYESLKPRVVLYGYDVMGRRVREVADPGTGINPAYGVPYLNLETTYQYDENGNVVVKKDAANNYTRYIYDAEDRLRFTVDALHGVTEKRYDARGRVTQTLRYARALTATSITADPTRPLTLADITAAGVLTTTADDRVEQTIYDRDGRAVFEIDAARGIIRKTFDGNGNVTQKIAFVVPLPTNVAADYATLVGWADLRVNDAENRYTRTVYDLRGEATYSLDASNALVGTEYDATGNVIAQTAYTRQLNAVADAALLADLTDENLRNWTSNAANQLATDRTTRFYYDGAGRAIFQLDAEGYLSETRYDDVQNTTTAISYYARPALGAAPTLQDVRNAVAAPGFANPLADRSEMRRYDAAGRLERVTDAYGYFETYEYDAAGNKTAFVNKKNARWTYQYDANGRMTEEHSPTVAVTNVTPTSDDSGLQAAIDLPTLLVTRMTYDALGNIRTRTEAFGVVDQLGRSLSRTTTYVYDALGRQTKTILPEAHYYSGNIESDALLTGASVTRTEQALQLEIETRYNALGDAVWNRDVNGKYTHKVYDKLGRVTHDIDALGHVSFYGYDTFGNRTSVKRYAAPLNGTLDATPLTALDMHLRLSPGPLDRVIVTLYDKLNRIFQVAQAGELVYEPGLTPGQRGTSTPGARAITNNYYNAFGDLTRQEQLLTASPQTWAKTYFYYDRMGRQTEIVDAGGYLTHLRYDAEGNLTRRIEFAEALTAGSWTETSPGTPTPRTPTHNPGNEEGYDRETWFDYDRLNRKISETLVNFEHDSLATATDDSSHLVGNRSTTFGYDVLGNQTRVTVNGASTYTYYDTLGRVIAVAEPVRNTGSESLAPFTEMKRDAYGNMVVQKKYARGVPSAGETALPPVALTHADDRITYIEVDSFGRAIRTQDANGANRFASYTRRGDVAKEWQLVTNPNDTNGPVEAIVTIYHYDDLGRQIEVIEPKSGSTPGALEGTIRTITAYNAFGEIRSKTTELRNLSGVVVTNQANGSEYFDYDNAGRLWRTNSGDGVDKVYLYNLLGKATAEIRSRGTTDLQVYGSAAAVDALTIETMRTETIYDALGRVIEQRQPTLVVSAGPQPIIANFVIGDFAGPSNPRAYYRRPFNDQYGASSQTDWQVDPDATVAEWGQYYFDTALGQWRQDTSSTWVTRRFIHWNAPEDVSLIKRFWLSSNNGATWTQRDVYTLWNGELGVSVADLGIGNYMYRVEYLRTGDTQALFQASGNVQIVGNYNVSMTVQPGPAPETVNDVVQSGSNLTWTTNTSTTSQFFYRRNSNESWQSIGATYVDSGGVRTYTAPVGVLPSGDFSWRVENYRSGSTVAAKEGTFHTTGQSQVRDPSPTLTPDVYPVVGNVTATATGTSFTLAWNAQQSIAGDSAYTANVRLVKRDTGQTWNFTPQRILGSGSPDTFRLLVDGFQNGTYDYTITYVAGGLQTTRAAGAVTFTQAVSSTIVNASLTPSSPPAPPPMPATVEAWSVPPTGGSVTLVSSSFIETYWDPVVIDYRQRFAGTNRIDVTWTNQGHTQPIRIEVVYIPRGSGFEESRSFYAAGNATSGSLIWNETGEPNPFFNVYGIQEIRLVRVHGPDDSVVQEFAPGGRYGLQWAAPAGTYNEQVSYKLLTATEWTYGPLTNLQTGPNRILDLSPAIAGLPPLDPGNYEYRIQYSPYVVSGYSTTAYTEVRGRFDLMNGPSGRYVTNVTRSSAQTFEPTYLTSANMTRVGSQIHWTAPAPAGYEVDFIYRLNGGPEQLIGLGNNGTNNYSIDLALLGQGDFTYTIRHRRVGFMNSAYGTGSAHYSVTNTNTPASVTPSSAVPTSQIAYISSVSASLDVLSWTYPPLPNSEVILRVGGVDIVMSGNGPTYSHTFPLIASDDFYYQIFYRLNGQTEPYAYARGRLYLIIGYHFEPGVISNVTQTHAYPTIPPVSDLTDLGNGTLYWSDAATVPGSNVYVRYRSIGGAYSDPQLATPYGAGYSFDFTNVMALGTSALEYEIEYRVPGENAYRRSTGRLDYTKTLNVTPHLQDTTVQTEFTQARTPRIRQTLDRWGNALSVTDTGEQTTNYRYNQLDQVIETLAPNVAVFHYTGAGTPGQSGRPRSTNYYDQHGRLIATRDANRNLNRASLNAAGQTLDEFHADGGQKHFVYDAFGQLVRSENERGYLTRYSYDRMGQLTATETERVIDGFDGNSWMPNATIRHSFGYDAAGRRVWETTGETVFGGADERYRYYYDLQGNVRRRVTPLGYETLYGYDIHGSKVSEVNAIGDSMTWSYDYFGRLRAHTDLTEALVPRAGANYTYLYNEAGQLYHQYNNEGQRIDYVYDGAGNLKTITEQMNAAAENEAEAAGLAEIDRVTSFDYDSAGRRSREKTVIDGVVHQDTRIGYDALNRVNRLSDLRYQVTYGFDANGNRTHILATYYDHQQIARNQNLYYTYDGMNRVRISQGALVNGSVEVTTTQGTELNYYMSGERHTALSYGVRFRENSSGYYKEAGLTLETYEYDGLGRLSTVRKDDVLTNSYEYDRASRETYEQSNTIEGEMGPGTLKSSTRVTSYDDDGRISEQTTYRAGNTTLANRESRVLYGTSSFVAGGWSRGYDGAGNLRSYLVTVYDTNGTSELYQTTYAFQYRAGETYQETQQTASTNNPGVGRPETGTTTRTYNVAGELVAFADLRAPGAERNRYFANSASGQPLTVVQGAYGSARSSSALSALEQAVNGLSNGPRAQHFFFANGQATGSFGQLRENGVFDANFDVNYTPISADYPSSAPSTVVAQNGDTLRAIAARIFGDASLWFILAEENGLTDPDATLEAGAMIRVPNEVISLSNSANVFRPFDATDALGDTTPTQPIAQPRKNKGCGVLGQIIVIVVVIVVAYYTGLYLNAAMAGIGGAGAGAGGAAGAGAAGAGAAGAGTAGFSASSFAIGAISAGVGNAAGQVVGMALGVQDEFSWKAVGVASLTGGILKGTPLGAVGGDSIPSLIAQGAVNNAVTQGVNIALGLQSGFDWREVAIAAVSAPVAQQVEKAVGGRGLFLPSAASSLASAGVRVALVGKIDVKSVLADAFGQALGNSILDAVSSVGTAAENPVQDEPGRSRTGVEEIEEVVVTAQRRASGDDRLVSNPSLAQTAPGGAPSAADVSYEAEMPEVVVSGNRSVANQIDFLERMRLRDVRVAGQQAIARVHAYNRLIDHGISLARTEQLFATAARQGWWDTTEQTAFMLASGMLEDPELRESILTAAGLTDQDLTGLDAADAFEKISQGAYRNLENTLNLVGPAQEPAQGHYTMPDEARFLDLLGNDFQGAGSRNLAEWVASQSPGTSVFVLDQLGAHMRADVAAVRLGASVGLLPRSLVEAVAASADETMSSTLWDAASAGLKGKVAIAAEVLGMMPLIGDAQAGTGAARSVKALNGALGKASRSMARLQEVTKDLTGSFFDTLAPLKRGFAVESDILEKVYKTTDSLGNTAVIDYAKNGTVASIKSIDLNSLRALDPKSFERVVRRYMEKVRDYKGGDLHINGKRNAETLTASNIKVRELTLGLSGAPNADQAAVLARLLTQGQRWSNQVDLRIVQYAKPKPNQ